MNKLLYKGIRDFSKNSLRIDGRTYRVRFSRRCRQSEQAPRLVVVSYQPNQLARNIVRVCIRAIQEYTPELHELWVVDNNSPGGNVTWLLDWPGINLVLNRTQPIPPEHRGLFRLLKVRSNKKKWGSYANAIGLELAVRLIDPKAQYVMTLHMDTMPCRTGWLSFLMSKMSESTAMAGVRMDKARTPEGVLHVLGYLVDFQVFRRLGLNFMPQLPTYDVGDRVTVALRNAGFNIFACRNTLRDPHLVETISLTSPFSNLHVDRSLDDNGNVIFLHLGRGLRKASGIHCGGIIPEEWIRFAETLLLS